jgi:tetratricopeptide (TPR) repeat protein
MLHKVLKAIINAIENGTLQEPFSKQDFQNDLDRAIEDYNKAIQLNPNLAEAYYNRGVAYDDKGQYNEAIKDFDEAIRINPNLVEAYCNRGVAYYAKGQYNEAIKDFDEAIRINPNLAEAYYNRGNAYTYKGQYMVYPDFGGQYCLSVA